MPRLRPVGTRRGSIRPRDTLSVARALPMAVAATILLILSNGRFSLVWAAWLAPAAMLILLRRLPPRRAAGFGYPICWVACCAQWSGVFPVTGPLFYALGGLLCLVNFLPFLLDRLLRPRLALGAATLVLPTSLVVMEFLFARFGGYGSWGSLAYSQASAFPLIQVSSLTGMYGITFLIGWTAALIVAAAETVSGRNHGGAGRRVWVRRTMLLGVALLAVGAAWIYGVVRTSGPDSGEGSLRVATASPRCEDDGNYRIRNAMATQDSLLARSERLARAGAQLIIWPESSFSIFKTDEPDWFRRAGHFTATEGVELIAAYAVRVSEEDDRYENKMVFVGEHGDLRWEYRKSHPVPGMEPRVLPGDGRIATAMLNHLRVVGMICFDADHAELMGQTGEADLLIVPSEDWEAIVRLHAAMIQLRAVEYGLPIVRSTLHGASAAFDGTGRLLGLSNDADPHTRTLLVDVALGRRATLYARIGDLFAYVCVLGLAALLALSIRARRGATTLPSGA